MRNTKLWLLLIILLAFGLRTYQLDNSSFWLDEGLTPLRSGYSIAEILSNRITIQDGVTKDTHPPLYYLLIHFSRSLLGESDFSYRYPSVIAGVLLVPLLFQLARRIDDSKVALLAAFLAAVNPLQIWYAQEARMYTLLVLLAAAATLALWKAFSEQRLFQRLALYGLFASLAFYTHYTAIFLIGVQGLFWVWLLWRQGYRRLLIGGAALGFLIALPLLPFVIPRLFTGAEAKYFYVPPWIMLQDVVHGFGLGLTVDFSQAGIKLLDLGGLLLLLAGLIGSQRPGKAAWSSRSFLLAYLLAAVVGLMAGSLVKPMYMGARHIMVGSPAFLLLAARGLFALPRRPLYLVPLVGVTVILVGPAVSLHNLYHNPYYAKDDVRALIKYVEQHAGGNDAIVYNNAILLPLHQHYHRRPDLPATALPTYPHPAGSETELQLQEWTRQFDRIWFVTDPPVDKRDEKATVQRWLEENLSEVDKHWFHGRSMEAKVVAYATAPWVVENLPAGGHPLDLSFEGLPPLRGLRFGFEQPAALPALWLDLFWQGGNPPSADKQLRFVFRGQDGDTWLDHNQPFRSKDARSWPDAGLVRSSYGLPVPAGTPPGDYELLLLVWDNASGKAISDWQHLASIEVASSDSWPSVPDWPFAATFPLRFANGLELLSVSNVAAEVRPGHNLALSLYWRALSPPADLRYQLEVVGPDGEVLHISTEPPGPDWLDGAAWPLKAIIVERIGIYFPPEVAPGRYRFRWRLLSGDTSVPGRPAWRPWNSDSVIFGHVMVQPWPLETELPAVSNLVQADYGSAIQLYGYELDEDMTSRLDLTLYWLARETPDRSYHAFVHLVSADDGTIVSQLDRIPADWLRPTNGWRPGEILTDIYQLSIPEDLAPGDYHLYVGMYDPDSRQRLPVTFQGEAQTNDQFLIITTTLP